MDAASKCSRSSSPVFIVEVGGHVYWHGYVYSNVIVARPVVAHNNILCHNNPVRIFYLQFSAAAAAAAAAAGTGRKGSQVKSGLSPTESLTTKLLIPCGLGKIDMIQAV